VNNLNLKIFKYLLNILVTVESYGLWVYITIKKYEKDRRLQHPQFFHKNCAPENNISVVIPF
jgi:hypothetical protein